MSSSPNDPSNRRRVSKVTFSPISSELLIVRIRKMSNEVREEDIPEISNTFQPILRNQDSADQNESTNHSRSTMTDKQKIASSFSQTISKEKIDSYSKTDNFPDSTPCLKHAAQNLSRKASDIPSEKISLCNNCSKSMLSYIFLVQDFLDSLAKEISGDETSHCLQCARQEVRNNISTSDARVEDLSNSEHLASTVKHSEYKSSGRESKREVASDRPPKRTTRAKSHRQESKKNEDHQKRVVNLSPQGYANQQSRQVDFLYNVSPSSNISQDVKIHSLPNVNSQKLIIQEQQSPSPPSNIGQDVKTDNLPNLSSEKCIIQDQQSVLNQQQTVSHQHHINLLPAFDNPNESEPQKDTIQRQGECISHSIRDNDQHFTSAIQPNEQPAAKTIFRSPVERTQPNYDTVPTHPECQDQNFPVHSPILFRDDVGGMVSTLSNTEREIYDSARNGAGWESLTEPQERLGPPSGNVIASEAFVTSCRNNAEAVGCLVVGTSLLICRTSRTLCVLVSDGVSTAFRGALSSVFQVVQYVRSLDSLGTTKLSLLEQPELGITFEKLNIWRLTQFTKCIYLNPDTLVIQNCDELFCHEELSAVPDIGWPDCFNSGVFVFSPSVHTFWQLLEFAEKQGSYDGGDQGLLNFYFNSWSLDINKKLSFIYNLMANVSYTYTPAFRQFGSNVKIVQFHGSFKPWHVKFLTSSGQVSPSSSVHPTYSQFVQMWLKIFRLSVLRLMSQEIQSYAASQETICAVEILRFFPLPTESEAEFFLSPPSVRLRLAEKKLSRSTSLPLPEVRRRKSAEFFRYTDIEDETIPETSTSEKAETGESEFVDVPRSESGVQEEEKSKANVPDTDEVFTERAVTEREKIKGGNTLPGAEVGDYQGMEAWEQGRMDYQGTDSSDNVIKRLKFLMSRPK